MFLLINSKGDLNSTPLEQIFLFTKFLFDCFFDAVSGKKDAKTAANDAVTLIKETIKQKFGE